jgi:hypothetical protein
MKRLVGIVEYHTDQKPDSQKSPNEFDHVSG